jgi:hypothetical protein
MYNPVTSRAVISCDAIWLGRLYYIRQVSHSLDKKMPVVSVPTNMNEFKVKDNLESLEVVTCTSAPATEEREGTTNVSSEKSNDWVTTKTRFGRKVERKTMNLQSCNCDYSKIGQQSSGSEHRQSQELLQCFGN